jgi:hypothetical protein
MSALVATEELAELLPINRKLRLATEIFGAYGRVRWLLWRRRDLSEILLLLRRSEGARLTDPGELTQQRAGFRLGEIVGRTLGVLPADSRCLVRSLVLTALLARRGIASSLVIGVRAGPDFAAHAWVETDGRPLLQPAEWMYSRLVEL